MKNVIVAIFLLVLLGAVGFGVYFMSSLGKDNSDQADNDTSSDGNEGQGTGDSKSGNKLNCREEVVTTNLAEAKKIYEERIRSDDNWLADVKVKAKKKKDDGYNHWNLYRQMEAEVNWLIDNEGFPKKKVCS